MQNRRLHTLHHRTMELIDRAADKLYEGRTEDELRFFATHGVFPEAVRLSERVVSTFVVRGLKTTVILEKAGEEEGSEQT